MSIWGVGEFKMRLSLAEPKYLKDGISIISDLVNEGRFKIGPDGIEMIAMDPANVAMVIFKLFSSAFIEYDVKEEINIAVNLSNMKQILRRAKPSDTLTLELDQQNKLKIHLRGNTSRTFSLPLIDIEGKEQKIPDLSFPVTIETASELLNEAVEDVDVVGESVSFIADKGTFTISSEGDLSNAKIVVKKGDETKITINTDSTIKSKYSIEYLKKMVGGSKLADNGGVSIQFNNDYPLKLEYKTLNKVQLSFILAPRVENE